MSNLPVADEVARLIREGGRGTATRLARHIGTSNATISKWVNRQTVPDPTHWPGIEEFFELPPGHLTRFSVEGVRFDRRLTQIQALLDQVQAELDDMRRVLPPPTSTSARRRRGAR